MKDQTSAIKAQMQRSHYREHSNPIFLTSSFVYDSAEHAAAMFAGDAEGDIYSRFTNPNTTELVNKICQLEGAESGVVTSSGMSAIFTTLAAHLKSGDHVVACSALFGNTTYILNEILPDWGITSTLVDVHDRDGWESAFQSSTKMVLIETPTNPGLEILDLEWLGALCKHHNVLLCVDNCFATPILQKPISYGADLVIHSATKWMDGQGRVLAGAIVGSQQHIEPIFNFLRRTGACLSPFNAWILSKSLETLAIRMDKHCQNALALARWLENHDQIEQVRYPFLSSHPDQDIAKKQMTAGGGIITINIRGDQRRTYRLINQLTVPSITANLGDSRSIVTHPSTTTHSKLSLSDQEHIGILPNTVRISVGLENIEDLCHDFDQALKGSI